MTTERILDRVQKLYTHATSAQSIGNEAEAMAFLAKVDALLTEHKLSRSVLDSGPSDDDDKVTEEILSALDGRSKAKRTGWIEQLASHVARAYFCRIMVTPGSDRITLVGTASDRQVASYVLRQLITFEKMEENRQYRAATYQYGFRASFRAGFVLRIAARLGELRKVHEQDPGTGSRYALVRVSSERALSAYIEPKSTGKASRTRFNTGNSAGMAAGTAAGGRANLGANGVSGGSAGVRALGSGR